MTTDRAAIAIVGAGPRGTGMLERIAASVPELLPRVGALDVHLIDPYPAGAGRIWRHEQSPLLAMNSMAADVTMFTDDSVRCDGPIVSGPSMWDWAQDLREGRLPGEDVADLGPELAAELRALTAATFPSRRLQSAYLGWVLRHVIADLPAGVRVHVHECRATGLTDDGAAQLVHLDGGAILRVDAVVLASGHLDATPTDAELDLAARAAAAGLRYLPPEQTTDSDLSGIEPGEPVIVRGTGLAFVDLVVLLFEGRGGRYEPGPDGELRYVPSGREPVLHVGSPRGSLYHAKTEYALRGGRPTLPRFLGPEAVDPLVARGDVDLRTEVWPLMAKEIAWGWYHELLHGHPDRVRLDADTFTDRYSAAAWGSPEMVALLDEAVPDRPGPHRLRRAGPSAGRRPRRLAGRAAAAGARAHRGRPASARRPRAHPAPRRVRGDAVGLRAGHAPGHRGRADRPLERPRHPLVAGVLQRGRERSARVPGPADAGAVPRRVRAVPRAGDVDGSPRWTARCSVRAVRPSPASRSRRP